MGALLHGGEHRQRRFVETVTGKHIAPGLTDERINAALEAYHSNSDGWRSMWAEVLNSLTMRMAAQELFDMEVAPIPGQAMMMFGMLTLMFVDLENGAIPSLAAPKTVSNRRPDSLSIRLTKVELAVLVGLEMQAGRKKGIRNEPCFRKASDRLRKAGASIRWKELRSIWHNRYRMDDFSLAALEQGLRTVDDPNWPSEQVLNEQAARAARKIQKPPSSDTTA